MVMVTTSLENGDKETGTIPGDLIQYNVIITNTGTVTSTHALISDSLLSIAVGR